MCSSNRLGVDPHRVEHNRTDQTTYSNVTPKRRTFFKVGKPELNKCKKVCDNRPRNGPIVLKKKKNTPSTKRYDFAAVMRNVVQYLRFRCSKKNPNVFRPSGHPPVTGENVKTVGGIIGCNTKPLSRHLNGFPDCSNIESTV